MAEQCDIKALIDNNRESITAMMKEEAASKDYLTGLNLPSGQIVDMVVKDYLETIILCYETGSLITFEEKLRWFFPMYKSRKGEDHPKGTNTDFFRILRSALLTKCGNLEPKLVETLDQMEALIAKFESGEIK